MEELEINLIRYCGLRYLIEYGDELFIVDLAAKTVTRQFESLELLLMDEWYMFDTKEDYSEVANLFEECLIN